MTGPSTYADALGGLSEAVAPASRTPARASGSLKGSCPNSDAVGERQLSTLCVIRCGVDPDVFTGEDNREGDGLEGLSTRGPQPEVSPGSAP